MLLIFSLLLAGGFTQLVNDPTEMRFCAAGSAIYADEARKRDGQDSDDGQFFDIAERKFKNRLTELDANDPALFLKVKAVTAPPLGEFYRNPAMSSDSPPIAKRFSDCLNLYFAAQENEALTDTAKWLDREMKSDGERRADATFTTKVDFNPMEFMALATASEARKAELRCAVNAAMLVKRKTAQPAQNDWGMTEAKSNLLERRVTEMLVIETGVTAKVVKALLEDVKSNDPVDLQDAEVEGCKPLFDSIDLTAEDGGNVGALSALAAADQPTTPLCYALLSRLAKETPDDETVAAESKSAAQKIADDYLLQHADDPEMAGSALALALADLDRKAKIGHFDKDSDVRIAACWKMVAEIG